eukprot:6531021-Alexandrium_andersonii.AAC.1
MFKRSRVKGTAHSGLELQNKGRRPPITAIRLRIGSSVLSTVSGWNKTRNAFRAVLILAPEIRKQDPK